MIGVYTVCLKTVTEEGVINVKKVSKKMYEKNPEVPLDCF
jgi:hypothetical protein